MAGIHFAHIENGLLDSFQDSPLFHLLLCGIKGTVGTTSICCLPITMSLLHQVMTELAKAPDVLPPDKRMLWSAFRLAFCGFLCSSELTSPSTMQCNALIHLSHGDISFTSDGSLYLQLKASKTHQYPQGCSLFIAPSSRSVCAVQAIHKYIALRSATNEAPLCVFHAGLYLTRAKATSILHLPL